MSNLEKYINAFVKTFNIEADKAPELKYLELKEWDSVGHMSLIAEIEDTFDIVMDTDDILDFESFAVGKDILSQKYDVKF